MSVSPSPRDLQVAQSVQDVVNPRANPIDNIVNVNQKIEDVAQNQVRPLLQQNPAAFNLKTLNSYIENNTQVPNYIKADPVLQRTYDLTRQSMIEEASKGSKNLEGLWDSRISFDHVAENQVGNLNPTDVKVSVIKQAVLDTRRAVNDYITENLQEVLDSKIAEGSLPAGTRETFTSNMKLLNHMYEARSNIATNSYKQLGSNAITRWIKANPTKAKWVGYTLGAVGLEKVLKMGGIPLP